ncbi:MAG: O-methyltransferase [Trebonia sp.]
MAELVDPAAQRYACEHTTGFEGAAQTAARWTQKNTADPGMAAGVSEARLLEALVVSSGAMRVLEIGTFTGVGALSLAAALPSGGRVITLEINQANAAAARRHIEASAYADRIELIVGDAKDTLQRLDGPFDLVWIDAWKADYPAYYDLVVGKLAATGLIAADNLFRDGLALDPSVDDPGTEGIRAFARRVQDDTRMHNALLTIGDGVMLAWRRPDADR